MKILKLIIKIRAHDTEHKISQSTSLVHSENYLNVVELTIFEKNSNIKKITTKAGGWCLQPSKLLILMRNIWFRSRIYCNITISLQGTLNHHYFWE